MYFAFNPSQIKIPAGPPKSGLKDTRRKHKVRPKDVQKRPNDTRKTFEGETINFADLRDRGKAYK